MNRECSIDKWNLAIEETTPVHLGDIFIEGKTIVMFSRVGEELVQMVLINDELDAYYGEPVTVDSYEMEDFTLKWVKENMGYGMELFQGELVITQCD